jgi:hypothetical protein
MLKHTIVCVMLVAAAAMGWQRLTDVPHRADVQEGTHLAWGDTLLWGMFPSGNGDNGTTYLFSYNPDSEPDLGTSPYPWDTGSTTKVMAGVMLTRTGFTYQWQEQPVVYATGRDPNTGISRMYRYYVRGDSWKVDNLPFGLGKGACIAYAPPSQSYDVLLNPVPGSIFCLQGDTVGGENFWQYQIPAFLMPDPGVYGYLYPDTGVTIADPTPPFRWSPSATTQYRIQVSTDPNFSIPNNVIDTVVTTNQCKSTTTLTNGTYYWRVATWNQGGGGSWAWPIIRYHFEVMAGWTQIQSATHTVGLGAEIAYDDATFGHKAILALYGRMGQQEKYFSDYYIGVDHWTGHATPPHYVYTGTSLTTNAERVAAGAGVRHIDAAFYNQDAGSCPYYYVVGGDSWAVYDTAPGDSLWNSHFPDNIDYGSSMVIGADKMMYLTTGRDHRFYGLEPPIALEGEQTRSTPSGKAKAQVITAHDGIEVEYQLPVAAHVRAALHDAIGRRVGMLDAGEQNAGKHRLSWNRDQEGRKLSAGAYFVLLDMDKKQARLKAVVR